MSKANPRFHRNNALLPLLTVPAYRIQVFYQVDQQVCLWTQDYIMSVNAQSPSSEANLATTFYTACNAAIRGALASDCFFIQVKVQCLTTPSRMPAIAQVATGVQAGTVVSSHIPSEMAAIISKATPTKGQHGRGRIYLPGIPSTFLTPATDANRLNATGTTAVQAVATALLSASIQDSTNSANVAVTQTVRGGAATTRGQILLTFATRLLLGTVRRRRISRGK